MPRHSYIKKRRKGPCANLFLSWCALTTAHGWADWVGIKCDGANTRSKIKKFIWTVTLFIVLLFLLHQITQILIDYFEGPVYHNTIYRPSNKENALPYPEIVICSYNRIWKSKADGLNMSQPSKDTILELADAGSSSITNEGMSALVNWTNANEIQSYMEIFDKIGPVCTDISSSSNSKFGKTDLNLCTSSLVTVATEYSAKFGKCYRFSFDSSVVIARSTDPLTSGLRLILTNAQNEQISFGVSVATYREEGYAIRLQDQEHWINVPYEHRSQLTFTKVQHKFSSQLITPHFMADPCDDNPPNNLVFTDKTPVSKSCETNCALSSLDKTCGCMPYFKTKGSTECTIKELITCINDSTTETQTAKDIDQCRKNCPPKCYYDSYKLTTNRVLRYSSTQMNGQTILDLSYSDLDVMMVETSKRLTMDTVLGTIGGQMGLWTGASLLTIVQMILHFCCPCLATYDDEDEVLEQRTVNDRVRISRPSFPNYNSNNNQRHHHRSNRPYNLNNSTDSFQFNTPPKQNETDF